ncbi:MAG TPA: Gfo/Idh/MocA family oxidoreductase [Candidatus Acidoferrales bacterium]|nr:Gfo/Idh/MocA family oxidoreductase [Candidatus Acidoferrales bacterium]
MSENVKIGVVGVGHLGQSHARLLKQIGSADLAGVFDIDKSKSQSIAAELNVRSFGSVEEVLNSVEAVSIAVPTSVHYDLAARFIEEGKHCFIEKPVTSTVEEAEAICRLSKEKKVKVQVGHIERFNPAVLALSNLKLDPMFIESHRLAQFKPRALDVAVVLDLMVHDIDLILNFVKSPVTSIDASGVGVISDTIDIANARIKFKNGTVANLTSSRISQRQMRKMRLFQRDAYISLDFADGIAEIYRAVKPDKVMPVGMNLGTIGIGDSTRAITYEQPEISQVNSLKMELELFVKSIIDDTPAAVSPEEGLKVLKVADTILRQIEESKKILNL